MKLRKYLIALSVLIVIGGLYLKSQEKQAMTSIYNGEFLTIKFPHGWNCYTNSEITQDTILLASSVNSQKVTCVKMPARIPVGSSENAASLFKEVLLSDNIINESSKEIIDGYKSYTIKCLSPTNTYKKYYVIYIPKSSITFYFVNEYLSCKEESLGDAIINSICFK